jgi:CheY-like chemotaxis protein
MGDSTQAGKTILVVEDDEVAREWFVAILAVEGYDAVVAADGAQALDYLRAHPPPDLIVLDMLLPVLDGWRFLEDVRRAERYRHVPILVVTSTILTREWARDNGCAGLLRKPVRGDELLAEVRHCLGGTPA